MDEKDMTEDLSPYKMGNSILDPPKKEPRKEPTKKAEKPKLDKDPVYIATGSFTYRFICDGTTLRLVEGVAVNTTEARLKELKRYGHVKEVK